MHEYELFRFLPFVARRLLRWKLGNHLVRGLPRDPFPKVDRECTGLHLHNWIVGVGSMSDVYFADFVVVAAAAAVS